MQLPNLVEALYARAKKEIKVYPCHNLRASSIGDDCERKLTYSITNWRDKQMHGIDLQLIFDEGKTQEKAILRDLEAAGIDIIEQQVPVCWEEYNITGHPDGVIVVDGAAVTLEVKSMSTHIWNTIFRRGAGAYNWEEVKGSFTDKPWLRRYYSQLQVYLKAKDTQDALMVCKDKSTGAISQIHVQRDEEHIAFLAERAERINAHVADGTLPDRIEFDAELCSERFCPFLHLCLPDHVGKEPIAFVTDEVAQAHLDKREELEEASREYKAVDAWVKDWIWAAHEKDERFTVNGSWLIEKSLTKNGRRQTKITRLPCTPTTPGEQPNNA